MKTIYNKSIWCTLGPSSMSPRIIKRLDESGVTLFRINLSHTPIDKIKDIILEIKKYTSVPICLDTEGPQVRTGKIKNEEIILKENDYVLIHNKEILGNEKNLFLRPSIVFNELKIGDLISIDFDSVLLAVKEKNKDGFITRIISGGKVGSNKAVTIDRKITMPIITNKDLEGINIINDLDLKHLTLSFVNSAEDVKYVRNLLNADVLLISKIETTEALINLDEIINISDGILIDRGDLSREQPINKIPLLQKKIIEHSINKGKEVFVATNLLESMVHSKVPLRSEVNDIINTLIDGATGLVLAAETAIGKHPIECVNMVNRLIRYYIISQKEHSLKDLLTYDSFLLTPPHGGKIIDRVFNSVEEELISKLPKLLVDNLVIMDAEQIGVGSYSPIEGFMCSDEMDSVLNDYVLLNGEIWPIPILLQVSESDYQKFSKGMEIALVYNEDNTIYATLIIDELFKISIDNVARGWFGTNSKEHPGVQRLLLKGPYCIGGKIKLIKRKPSLYKEFEFTPKQLRTIFSFKGWSKIAAFHSRNPIHRAHESLQIRAIEKYNLDGILLHPVVGAKKKGDFLSNVIIESYQIMIDKFYPINSYVFGTFAGYSHYAGPREALFTALVRKNFGCNYFILGRDHTGVGDYYTSQQTKELFEKVGEIGIKPIYFNKIIYSNKHSSYIEDNGVGMDNARDISGTEVRSMLKNNKMPPEWFMRKEISKMILTKIKSNESVFVDK